MRRSAGGSAASEGLIVLTWTPHRRTTSLGEQLGARVVEIATGRRGLSRYLVLATRTTMHLSRMRPRVIVAQSPSVVLVVLLLLLRPFFRYWLVVDAHNEAVQPYIHNSTPMIWLAGLCLRSANLAIVTNEELSRQVTKAGGRPFVLPDPLPRPPPTSGAALHPRPYLVVVSTFAPDEPIEEIIDAAASMPDLDFLVTGKAALCDPLLRSKATANVFFTGFLTEDAYWTALRHSQAIVDLTKMPDCLVCGAYEALAIGKPMVLTDSPAARRLFSPTAEFVKNCAPDIAAGVRRLLLSPPPSREATIVTYREMWDSSLETLLALLAPHLKQLG